MYFGPGKSRAKGLFLWAWKGRVCHLGVAAYMSRKLFLVCLNSLALVVRLDIENCCRFGLLNEL